MLFRVIICVAFLLIGSSIALALEPDEVFAKVSKSIVVVVGYNNSDPDASMLGSGVVIAPGKIVTNCHVIDKADQIWLKRNDFISLATLRFSDEARDLCQVSALNADGFEKVIPGIASVSELKVGQKVYAVGAPEGLELTLSDGLISALRRIENNEIVIQISAPISHGSSGGGLFDSDGRLIGITSSGFETGQNLNFAVPASYILDIERKAARLAQEEEQRRKEAQRRAEQKRIRLEEARRFAEAEEKRQLEEEREKSSRDYDDGLRAFNRGDYATALTNYEKAARQEHEMAQYYLGLMFDNGQGVNRDLDQAAYWYGQAALQGNKLAQSALDNVRKRRTEAGQAKRERIEEAQRLAEQKRLEEERRAKEEGKAAAEALHRAKELRLQQEEKQRLAEQERLRRENEHAKQQHEEEMERARERLRLAEEQCQDEEESCRRDVEKAEADVEQRKLEENERERQVAMRLEEQFRAEDQVEQRRTEQQRLERERELAEKKRQVELGRRNRIEAERQEKLRAAAAARGAQQQLVDDFRARISAKVRSRVVIPPNIFGNAEALYEVVLLPGGDVLSARLKKSSGVPAYDTAVHRAIMSAQPLPVPSDSDLFQEHFRRFNMSFRPKE